MDGCNKKAEGVSSTSSFTADLFGFKEPPPSSSSTGAFASIFQPPSAVLGSNSPISELRGGSWQKHHSPNPGWNTKQATLTDAASYNMRNNNRNSICQEERMEPCHLSSSIYYGGQDNYTQPPASQNSGSYPTFMKEGGEDDSNGNSSHGASRGNWWQGSLYY